MAPGLVRATLLAVLLTGCAVQPPATPPAAPLAAASTGFRGEVAEGPCPAEVRGYFQARLDGALTEWVEWRGEALSCLGMPRPDGAGLRLVFSGPVAAGRLTVVLAAPALVPGTPVTASADANVTAILEGQGLWGTRSQEACVLENLAQVPLSALGERKRWQVSGRGACLAPARDPVGRAAPLLLATFDFAGVVIAE